MKKLKDNKLLAIAYSGLAIAVLSAFTTIVGYTNAIGKHRSFSLLDLIVDPTGFGHFVFGEYTGKVYVYFNDIQIMLMIGLGAAAMVCALVGLMRLSKQTDNKTSYVLTILGLVGTMVPSVAIFICIVALQDSYLGKISCGIYPIVSPIAMLICIAAASQMRRRNVEYRKKLKEAEGLIFRAGDL